MKRFTEIVVGRKPTKVQVTNGDSKSTEDRIIITTNTGRKIWVSPSQDTGEPAISYVLHEQGDTFVATRNSSRKLNGEPLYLKGDTVKRGFKPDENGEMVADPNYTAIPELEGFCSLEVWKALKD